MDSIGLLAFVRLSKTLIAPFLIVKQFESVFLLSIRTQKWFLCPALPAIWWLLKSSAPGFMNPNWPGLIQS